GVGGEGAKGTPRGGFWGCPAERPACGDQGSAVRRSAARHQAAAARRLLVSPRPPFRSLTGVVETIRSTQRQPKRSPKRRGAKRVTGPASGATGRLAVVKSSDRCP